MNYIKNTEVTKLRIILGVDRWWYLDGIDDKGNFTEFYGKFLSKELAREAVHQFRIDNKIPNIVPLVDVE